MHGFCLFRRPYGSLFTSVEEATTAKSWFFLGRRWWRLMYKRMNESSNAGFILPSTIPSTIHTSLHVTYLWFDSPPVYSNHSHPTPHIISRKHDTTSTHPMPSGPLATKQHKITTSKTSAIIVSQLFFYRLFCGNLNIMKKIVSRTIIEQCDRGNIKLLKHYIIDTIFFVIQIL